MTAIDYKPFVERMIERYEGGYGWDSRDPGGPTNFGITCYDLAEHRHLPMNSMRAWAPLVRAMTLQEADNIYASKYATASRFNDLKAGADCVVFDFCVNSGSSRAIRTAQHLVGTTADGILGPITLKAINNYDTTAFIQDMCAARLSFLRALSIWGTFGRGWTSRVDDLRMYSLTLSTPTSSAKPDMLVEKIERIPMAFGKGYGAEEMPGSATPDVSHHSALQPSQAEYTVAANAILKELNSFIMTSVPDIFGYRERALAASPAFAGTLAKDAVDALASMVAELVHKSNPEGEPKK